MQTMVREMITFQLASKLLQGGRYFKAGIAGAVKDHKATTTCAGDLTTGSACLADCFVDIIQLLVRDAFGHLFLMLETII